MSTYDHTPHPHIEARKEAGPATVRAEHLSLNGRVGLLITGGVGTMWAAYLFTALALVSLGGALATHSTVIIVGWVAQTFLQLVLLPVIIVGQNVQARAADKRAEQTYNDAEAILHEALELQKHLAAQDTKLTQLVEYAHSSFFAQQQTATALAELKPKPRVAKTPAAKVE